VVVARAFDQQRQQLAARSRAARLQLFSKTTPAVSIRVPDRKAAAALAAVILL
jgi:hypothetical protein